MPATKNALTMETIYVREQRVWSVFVCVCVCVGICILELALEDAYLPHI